MQYHYAKVGFGISEYRTNRTGEIPDGLIIMQSPPPSYDWIANEDGTYSEIKKSDEEIAQEYAASENVWVKDEMVYADYQVNLHIDGDRRATLTSSDWSQYRCTLRDYVKDGVVTLDERPSRPE